MAAGKTKLTAVFLNLLAWLRRLLQEFTFSWSNTPWWDTALCFTRDILICLRIIKILLGKKPPTLPLQTSDRDWTIHLNILAIKAVKNFFILLSKKKKSICLCYLPRIIRIVGNTVQLYHTIIRDPHKTLISYIIQMSVAADPVAIFQLFNDDTDTLHTCSDWIVGLFLLQ